MPHRDEPPRRRLDRATVVREAIALADEDRLDALNMRALAARLGVVPMALYKHVADKDDLIARMVDLLIESYPSPEAAGDWRARVRARVLSAREAIVAHPWLSAAIDGRTRRTETVLDHLNAVAGDFIEGGVSPDLTHYAMHALGNRIWGYSTEAFDDADAPTTADADQPAIVEYMTARFPHVVTIAMDAVQRRPSGSCEQQQEFEFTLDLLLDSVERLHAAGWESRRA
ncbi:MAG: TetR/AcrR family transcriptional regulator [Leifsonia xyli]|nr:MAG: TetR/AcrR family transcriptional regulator [Leifsonia xyli]